jgi:hypothetical protein
MNDDEILEYSSEDLHNPVYAKPRTRPIISSSELVGRDNERVAKNMKNMGTIAYDIARVLPATRFATDIIDLGQGLINDEVDAGAPGYALGVAGDKLGDMTMYRAKPKLVIPSGNKLVDQMKRELGKAKARRHNALADAVNIMNKGAGIGLKAGGFTLKALDTLNDSAKLGEHLYQWTRYGDIDDKRSRLKEDIEDAVKEKAAKAAEVLKGINWRK